MWNSLILVSMVLLGNSIAFANTQNTFPTKNNNDLLVKGHHYMAARSGQTVVEKFSLTNKSEDVIYNIKVKIDNPDITLINHCHVGLLVNQACHIELSYQPKFDISTEHDGVIGKKNVINITYQKSSEKKSLSDYIVSLHYGSQRLVSIPTSLTSFHELPTTSILRAGII